MNKHKQPKPKPSDLDPAIRIGRIICVIICIYAIGIYLAWLVS